MPDKPDKLEHILSATVKAIESGKEEVFQISESTRSEIQRLTTELAQVKADVADIIKQVDIQTKLEQEKRRRLMEVSRDHQKHTEKDMMEAYGDAKDAQVKLQLLQAQEVQLRKRRNEIEHTLNQMDTTLLRADRLMPQISMAVNLLQGSLQSSIQTHDYEQRLEMGLSVIKAQEEERKRIARDIHDGPAQTLANIILRLEITEKLLNLDVNRAKAELQDLKNLVRANLQDIRRIIFNLRPMALDDLGIVAAISKYAENFQDSQNIKTKIKVTGREKRFHSTMEIALFRLTQEAMTNIAKHANTDKVDIYIIFKDELITIQIRDYGKGFDVDAIAEKADKHFGLMGMSERVEMFSGKFTIKSIIDKGTTVEMTIPFSAPKAN